MLCSACTLPTSYQPQCNLATPIIFSQRDPPTGLNTQYATGGYAVDKIAPYMEVFCTQARRRGVGLHSVHVFDNYCLTNQDCS